MQQFTSVWNALSLGRKVAVVVATLAMFAAVLGMSRAVSTTSMSLLYAGLEAGTAGEIVTVLEQRNIEYEVRGNSIYVDGQVRDELRLSLAAEGLPENGAQGYELLDSLNGIGTTSQMFDAAYWRAKEGELARTILASSKYKSARVHLSNMINQPFHRTGDRTASVTVIGQGQISADQARALKYLVASAVSGLTPESVSVIDGRLGSVVGEEGDGFGVRGADERAEELRKRVHRIVAARVGPENVAVEVSVETETDRESIISREFDPDSRVAISTETEEKSNKSNDMGSRGVTVASNLPEGDAGTGQDNKSSENRETTERTNFEVSETTREVLKSPGAVKRLSVAVLVDALREIDESGVEKAELRPQEELDSLRELVASAVGYDESRGDTITIKSMAFEAQEILGSDAETSFLGANRIDLTKIIQVAMLGSVAIFAIVFVLRPFLLGRNSLSAPQAAIGPPALTEIGGDELNSISGEIEDSNFSSPQMNTVSDMGSDTDFEPLPDLSMASGFVGNPEGQDPVSRLRKMIEERQEETVATLKNWMEDEETA